MIGTLVTMGGLLASLLQQVLQLSVCAYRTQYSVLQKKTAYNFHKLPQNNVVCTKTLTILYTKTA